MKIKVQQAQWVHVTDHNQWSRAARTMLFMQQLDFILAMRKCGHNRYVYSSTGRLLKPALWARADEDSLGKGPSGHQGQDPVCFLPSASAGSAGSLACHLSTVPPTLACTL